MMFGCFIVFICCHCMPRQFKPNLQRSVRRQVAVPSNQTPTSLAIGVRDTNRCRQGVTETSCPFLESPFRCEGHDRAHMMRLTEISHEHQSPPNPLQRASCEY